MAQDRKPGGGLEESAIRLAFGVFDHVRKRGEERKRDEARKAAAEERSARAASEAAAREEGLRRQAHATEDRSREDVLRAERMHEERMRYGVGSATAGGPSDEAADAHAATGAPGDGPEEGSEGGRRFSFDATSDFAARAGARYGDIRDKAGVKVTEALGKGAKALDGRVGDVPWQILGMDERGTKVAREVMRDVVPDVVGERTSAFIDGVAVRGGLMGAGAAMRMSLRSFAGPMITGLAAVEAARAVQEIKDRAGDIGVRIDREGRP